MKALKSVIKFFMLYILTTILIIVITAGYIYIDNNSIELTKYEFYSPKLPTSFDGYKIMLVSDYHDAYYYDKVIKGIESQKPDVIFLLGDMVHIGNKHIENTKKLLDGIKDIAPIYAITGNHEEYAESYDKLIKGLSSYNVKFLFDKSAEIQKGNSSIFVYGLKDTYMSNFDLELKPSWLQDKMKKLSEKLDRDRFNILLLHRANLFPEVSMYGYDVVFSGHLHGGLVRLPIVGGLMGPEDSSWFPEYTKGMYFLDNSRMIVSRGLDHDKQRIRVFNGPELVMVTLKR